MAEPVLQQALANDDPAALAVEATLPGPGSKRQRRPSVRLGDIGEQPAAIPHEPLVRRSKHWKHSAAAGRDHPRHPHSSKARPVITSVPDGSRESPGFYQAPPASAAGNGVLLPVDENLEPLSVGVRRNRDAKARRSGAGGAAGRRARSSWTSSKVDEGIDATAADLKSSGGEDVGEGGCREFDDLRAEDSESPSDRREAAAAAFRVRVPETEDMGHDGDAPEEDAPSENDGGDWNDQNGRCGLLEDGGVRSWLSRLGLDRYAPLFEIHEVDDEVLPLLTMEDLKDMGINAVGSRRKMYCAIQKLKKGLPQESLHEECG
ncbi:hypothetical protein OPV22_015544 [Ensete ventricosum]|uniref:SAM domain-containing protein n=1 Tax=Ensete ventricosum TaxID=4639 RepID=A0AAV8PMA2_ENSVE|nr:hypothetical protein OPV22_015544 [Ensete ventricosum]RWW17271.1 hypothetical protein GW17_00018806 [Ensete ventricosum]